jgi:hypothetical protein
MPLFFNLIEILKSMAMELPMLIVCLVGFIMAILRARRYGKAAMPAMLGFGFAIMQIVFNPPLVRYIASEFFVLRDPELVFTTIAVIQSICWAGIFALLLMSINAKDSQQ